MPLTGWGSNFLEGESRVPLPRRLRCADERTSGRAGADLYSISIEDWIEADHPLRAVKRQADAVLRSMRGDFDRAYSRLGRPGIPPEMLLKTLLLQALYSVRSERRLVGEIRMNLLYRWFLDLSLDAPVWDATTFTKNRERFEQHGLLREFFDRVVEDAYLDEWASAKHFSVDGTLIESCASMKSVRPLERQGERVSDAAEDDDPSNPTVSFRGERRSNRTHRSVSDPEARLYRKAKGQQARLCHAAHALMENRNGLLVDISVSEANGTAEREEALRLLGRSRGRHELRPQSLGADKGYDAGAGHRRHEFPIPVNAAAWQHNDLRRVGQIPSDHENFHCPHIGAPRGTGRLF